MTGGAGNRLIPYDEFGYFHENAAEFGLPYDGPPEVRRTAVDVGDGRTLSALVWGGGAPELVLIHGGGQNAHTWDTVAMALRRPLIAVDLPGHGHSDTARGSSVDVRTNAPEVAAVIRALAPDAKAVVGMSLGGMTTLALIEHAPELVRRAVLVDVTPGVNAAKSKTISDFINGPASFADFDELLARTIEYNPTRTVSSLRRGILHNAEQRSDGSWVWRYRRLTDQPGHPDFGALWDVVSSARVPLLLVRGMREQSVVDDADEREFLRRGADARVERVAEAGHSVQGDTPVELAALINAFAP
ncbi:MAG TPA: alpha/beta hydrolase [Mycobacteriales bacterium]|jgi:pimeloyl-ACP methyl ester carboxylesterase|nr:alpha/beta hydrolase [Mycobacteriales bacterium]